MLKSLATSSALRLWSPLQQLRVCEVGATSYATSCRAPPGDVPQGHQASDLSSVACNINLSRRRDLTLRQDLSLTQGSTKKSLAEVFKVGSGLAGCEPPCSLSHYSCRAHLLSTCYCRS